MSRLPEERSRSPVLVWARRWGRRIAQTPYLAPVAMSGAALGVASLAATTILAQQQKVRQAIAAPTPIATMDDDLVGPQSLSAEAFVLSAETLQDVSVAGAKAFNASLPVSTAPLQSAAPFVISSDDVVHYTRALDCLTAAVYYEAASESLNGQRAVAQVVLNRVRHPAYPRTICGVVFQGAERATGCQFTFSCDGALARRPTRDGWARARAVAGAALNGAVVAQVGMATHYHTDWVAPYWAPKLTKLGQVGAHIFYRWPGAWGLKSAFTGRYAGVEVEPVKMATLATGISLDEAPAIIVEAPLLTAVFPQPVIAPVAEPTSGPEVTVAPSDVAALPPLSPSPPLTTAERRPATPSNPLQPPQPQSTRRPRLPTPSSW
ncbi:cell wall hydrolase [Brevundimonas sp. VNH65]|uniref:cell wall hydrolase n=1 Tax=Brevundimonas sp. VNH65 TaxID=3400917 RepID=UPI003C0ADAAA